LPTGVRRVPNEKTVYCPEQVQELSREDALVGFDAVWLVENSATSPVSVGWVRDGVEYSAYDSKITPPHRDPGAILQPGQWKSFLTFEGHVFHVRQLLEDGTPGPILLQHRPGLIPIRNRYGPPLTCDPNEPDPEPLLEAPKVRHPKYARTPPQQGRPCNTLDVGFRNEVGCPLHVYYTGMQGANVTTGAPTCQESFKFHLGLNPRPNDFMWDWQSQTKYEGTFVGHHFAFRLAKDPSVLVDEIELQPTFVHDCPDLKQNEAIASHVQIMPMGILRNLMSNVTDTANLTIAYNRPLRSASKANDQWNNTVLAASYFVTSF
jgi:hypothetical protein